MPSIEHPACSDLPAGRRHVGSVTDLAMRHVDGSSYRAAMIDLRRADGVARAIATRALGRDAGPMALSASGSHDVYVGRDVVVKLIGAAEHSRLDREIALAHHLPVGLTAALIDSGTDQREDGEIRYACYERMWGEVPGIGLAGVEAPTARRWAADAIERLTMMHRWNPTGSAEMTLREPLDHGGFVGRATLQRDVEALADEDRTGLVTRSVLDRLHGIAASAPLEARSVVPIHADCHWGNWMVNEQGVVALLDFEWARFGEPTDDWFFLARFSGPHQHDVLDAVSSTTTQSRDELRAGCELREVSYLTSDLLIALRNADEPPHVAKGIIHDLEDVVMNHSWWRTRA